MSKIEPQQQDQATPVDTEATAESRLLNAVVYLRVSTKEQAHRGGQSEGFSIPAQREACLNKAQSLGAAVVAEFIDAESGGTTSRRELQKLLAYAQEESVQYVIVHKLDRLVRNRFDDLRISLTLEQAGVKLVSCSEAIETPSLAGSTTGC